MQPFDLLFAGVDDAVEALFSIPNVALWIAFALFGWCAWIIARQWRRRHRPFALALRRRLAATDVLAEAGDPRQAFAERFAELDAAMAEWSPGAGGLSHAWAQYRDTLLDTGAAPIAATARPDGFFLDLGDDGRLLAWWANIFVAVGLTFTFLGIVAALLSAVRAMGAGADPLAMQAALIALLHITAAKFWTSIGGVGSSIVLRVFDRRWHAANARGLGRLCERLERGTRLVLPQAQAAEQLDLLRRQVAVMERPSPATASGDAAAALAAAADRLATTLGTLEARATASGERVATEAEAAVRRAGAAADAQADTLAAAGDEVRTLLAALARVVEQVGAAFGPVRGAAETIARAVDATQDMLGQSERGAAAMREAAQGMAATTASATRAWDSYAGRFDAVDAALAGALRQIGEASAGHAAQLTQQAGRLDGALAQAVERLAGALDGLDALAAAIDDLRAERRAAR